MSFKDTRMMQKAFRDMSDALYEDVGKRMLEESLKQQKEIQAQLEQRLVDWELRVKKQGLTILKDLIDEKLKKDCECKDKCQS